MSLQRVFAAYVLYTEVFLVLLLSVPFLSNKFWARVFRFQLFSWIGHIGQHAFIVVAGILSLLFLDSIREIKKYESLADDMDHQAGYMMHDPHTNKFRAQRNFYISLFAFVFWILIRRLIDLISISAQLEASADAMQKQAEGASKMAQQLMENSKDPDEASDTAVAEAEEKIEKLKTKLSVAVVEKEKAVNDLDVLKKQAKATEKEYDRLMGEMEKMQNSGDKKDD